MRYLKHLVLMVLASMFLVACGGGGGSDTGSSTGGTDLKAAYDKVAAGMNYEQVKALVGYAHNNGESSSNGLRMYNWKSGTAVFLAIFNTSNGQVKQITHTDGIASFSQKDF